VNELSILCRLTSKITAIYDFMLENEKLGEVHHSDPRANMQRHKFNI
jgi:hypothetical protein